MYQKNFYMQRKEGEEVKGKKTRVVHSRVPLRTLVGCCELLAKQKVNTKGLALSSITAHVLSQVIESFIAGGHLQEHHNEELDFLLDKYLGISYTSPPPGVLERMLNEQTAEEVEEQVLDLPTFLRERPEVFDKVAMLGEPDEREPDPDVAAAVASVLNQELPPIVEEEEEGEQLSQIQGDQDPWSGLETNDPIQDLLEAEEMLDSPEGQVLRVWAGEDELRKRAARIVLTRMPAFKWNAASTVTTTIQVWKAKVAWLEKKKEGG